MPAGDFLTRLGNAPVAARVQLRVPLSAYTSFRVGGPADFLVEVESAEEIALVVRAAREARAPFTVIGLGTNLLVLDGGVRGVVLRIAALMGGMTWSDGGSGGAVSVICGAGAPLAALSRAAAARALAGLEFAEGIPGTVGGAVAMNAGAYGGEIGHLVEWVEAVDLDALPGPSPDLGPGERAGGAAGLTVPPLLRLSRAEMAFGYRHSVVQTRALAVTRVQLRLERGDAAEIGRLTAEYAERRRSRQPLEHPSAGSFFRRPAAGQYVGPMIEACGLKSFRAGGAEVSAKHANFIINAGGATAADIMAVASHVQRQVHAQFGVWLEPEVRIIGEHAAGDGG